MRRVAVVSPRAMFDRLAAWCARSSAGGVLTGVALGVVTVALIGLLFVDETVFQPRFDEASQSARALRESHEAMIKRLNEMSDADLARPYASYYADGRPDADQAIVNWISGNSWEHDADHLVWIRHQFRL